MRKKEERKRCPPHYSEMNVNDKLVINLRDLSHVIRFQDEGRASQKRILIILKEEGNVTQQELTRRLKVKSGSASEVLSKLESAGLITRTPNAVDRRTTDIKLTDKGRQLGQEAAEQRKQRHQEMFDCLLDDERQTLLALLEKVCADWEERYIVKDEAK